MKLIHSLVLLLILLLLTGCPGESSKPETQANPFAGVTLTVAVPPGVMSLDDWKSLSQDWSTRTTVNVQFVELATPYPHDEASSTAYTKSLRDHNPQLIIFPWQLKGFLGEQQLLAPLPVSAQEKTELDWTNYFAGLRKNICQVEEQPGLIPISAPTYKMFYRKDVLAQAQKNVPQTWEELIALGKEFSKMPESKKIILPLDETSRREVCQSILLPYVTTNDSLSLSYDFSSGKSTSDHPGFARGLATIAELKQIISPDSLASSSVTCLQQLLAGDAWLVISNEINLPVTEANPNSTTSLRAAGVELGIAPLPGVPEQYDFYKKAWISMPPSVMHRASLIDDQGCVAGITTLTPVDGEMKSRTQLAACNLLLELIKSGLVNAQGKSLLTPTCTKDLSSSVANLPEIYSFQEQTDILETIQSQLQGKLCFSPALWPQDQFENMWQEVATKIVTGTDPAIVSEELTRKNLELVEALTTAKVRDLYRAQLGLKSSSISSTGNATN